MQRHVPGPQEAELLQAKLQRDQAAARADRLQVWPHSLNFTNLPKPAKISSMSAF